MEILILLIEIHYIHSFIHRSPPVTRKFNGSQTQSNALSPPPHGNGSTGAGARSRSRSPSKMQQHQTSSPPLRSASPNLAKRLTKKTSFEAQQQHQGEVSVVDGVVGKESKDVEPIVNKYENTSDNGSEISDEGYRSLGLIQNGTNKRASMHSQASNEDAENGSKYSIFLF